MVKSPVPYTNPRLVYAAVAAFSPKCLVVMAHHLFQAVMETFLTCVDGVFVNLFAVDVSSSTIHGADLVEVAINIYDLIPILVYRGITDVANGNLGWILKQVQPNVSRVSGHMLRSLITLNSVSALWPHL